MGDPVPVRVAGPRTVVRYCPSTRIPLPSHAAAAACLSRHLARQPFGTRRAARCPSPGHDRDRSPSRTTRRATTWFPPRRVSPGRHGLPAPRRPPLAVGGTLPLRALPRSWRTVPLRCVDRLCCCFAARHWCSSRCCYHTPGSSSRQRRLWRPVCAGHLSTASSRGHQQSC